MAKPTNLVKFSSLAGVPCYYAAVNAGYGDLSKCKKSRTRELAPGFLKDMEATIREIGWVTAPYLGELEAITSGGAYVAKAGPHSKGQAYDLGGLMWASGITVTVIGTCNEERWQATRQYLIYLAVEAVIRKHFGTVLGFHYNAAHENHWHIQYGTKVGFWQDGFGATTRIRFLQEIMKHVWGIDMACDGKKLPSKKVSELRAASGVGNLNEETNWLQLLTLTSMKALQLQVGR